MSYATLRDMDEASEEAVEALEQEPERARARVPG
jgi:hypothetical protein